MKKVIVSRPRVGGSKTPRVKAQFTHLCDLEAFDGGPSKEGMRRRHTAYHGWDGKVQTDLLGPLRRFLQSHVGQDWNTVWAAICRHADPRDVMGLHLRFHASDYVAQVCEGEDGKLYDKHGREFGRWRGRFYIDPTTNQLRTLETKTPRARRATPPKVFAMDGMRLHKHEDGNWYRVKMAVWDGASSVFDCFIGGLSDHWTSRQSVKVKYGLSPTGALWYCMQKETANRKDIRKVMKQNNGWGAA
jgi:hypothetical protein